MTDIEDLAGNKFNPRKINNLLFRTKYSSEDEENLKLLMNRLLISQSTNGLVIPNC